jgi:hypothetical protein
MRVARHPTVTLKVWRVARHPTVTLKVRKVAPDSHGEGKEGGTALDSHAEVRKVFTLLCGSRIGFYKVRKLYWRWNKAPMGINSSPIESMG